MSAIKKISTTEGARNSSLKKIPNQNWRFQNHFISNQGTHFSLLCLRFTILPHSGL